jgi:hypothetical protein
LKTLAKRDTSEPDRRPLVELWMPLVKAGGLLVRAAKCSKLCIFQGLHMCAGGAALASLASVYLEARRSQKAAGAKVLQILSVAKQIKIALDIFLYGNVFSKSWHELPLLPTLLMQQPNHGGARF